MAPANHGGMSRHRLVYNDEGLRPGLISLRPGAGPKTGRISRQKLIRSVLNSHWAQVQAVRRIEIMRIGGVSFCSLAGAA
jgi:hypothetical protein